jgi:cell wall-associated NlpC family hydrolase
MTGKHGAAVAGLRSWRKVLALTVSIATAGAWIPFTTGGSVGEPREHDDDEDEFTAPAPIFEGHEFPTWPMAAVPGNTQHDSPPKPPKVKPKTEEHKPKPKPKAEVKKVHPAPKPTKPTSVLVAFLRAQLGKRYSWGGNGPNAYDCSGLTKAAYAKIGITLHRTSEMQSLQGRSVSLSHLEVGDLLFWGVPGAAYHVAIYVGSGKYIAAQNPSSGVVEVSMSHYRPNFARRIL